MDNMIQMNMQLVLQVLHNMNQQHMILEMYYSQDNNFLMYMLLVLQVLHNMNQLHMLMEK